MSVYKTSDACRTHPHPSSSPRSKWLGVIEEDSAAEILWKSAAMQSFFPSFLFSILACLLPFFLPTFLPSFLPSLTPSFLHSLLLIFSTLPFLFLLSFFLSSTFPSFLPPFFRPFLPSFLPLLFFLSSFFLHIFLSSFRPSCLPVFFPSINCLRYVPCMASELRPGWESEGCGARGRSTDLRPDTDIYRRKHADFRAVNLCHGRNSDAWPGLM